MSAAPATAVRMGPEARLLAFALEILEMCDWDYTEAESQMRHRLRRDFTPWLDVMTAYVASSVMGHARTRQRAGIPRPAPGEDRGLISLRAELEDRYARWSSWPLSDGTPLVRATRAQVLADAERYRAQGTTMLIRADWLELVLRRVDAAGAELVGGALGGKELYELYQAAATKWTA